MQLRYRSRSRRLSVTTLVLIALLAQGACKKDGPAPLGPETVAEPPAVKVTPYPVIDDVPKQVYGYGVFEGLDSLIAFGAGLMFEFSAIPPAAVGGILERGISNEFGLTDLKWMKRDAPVHVVAWELQGEHGSLQMVFPLLAREPFVAALPPDHSEGVGGNALAWTVGVDRFYANFLADQGVVVVTRNETRFASSKAFLEGKLLALKTASTFKLVATLQNIRSANDGLMQSLKAEAARGADPALPGAVDGHNTAQLGTLLAISDQLSNFVFTGKLEDGHWVASTEIQWTAGGLWELFIRAAASGTPRLIGHAPAQSYFVLGASGDRSAGKELNKKFNQSGVVAAVLGLEGEDAAAVQNALERVESLQRGDQSLALFADGSFPFAIRSVMSVSDGAKMRLAIHDLLALGWKSASRFAKEMAGDAIPPFVNLNSFPAAIQSVGPILMGFGVQIAYKGPQTPKEDPGSKGDAVSMDVVEIQLDFERLQSLGLPHKHMAAMRAYLPEKFAIVWAAGKDKAVFELGPNAEKNARGVLDGSLKSTAHSGIAAIQERAVPGASVLVWLSLLRGVEAFKAMPEVAAAMAAGVSRESGDDGLALSLGRVNDGTLRMNVDVSKDHLGAFVRAFRHTLSQR